MKKLLPAVFWGAVFLAFLTPMELGDVWWHLNTGRWIWQNGELPSSDPFSIPGETVPSRDFVLKGFWLCQVCLYGVYGLLGLPGLILLKSVLFSLAFFCIYRLQHTRSNGDSSSLLLMLLPAVFTATFYDEMRPQTFSFLFFSLTLFVLERRREEPHRRSYGFLPVIMLLWSNMHPGFVLGDLLILAYMVEALVSRSGSRCFAACCLLSLVFSALNPNGFEAVLRTAQALGYQASSGGHDIHEHLPMSEFASFTRQSPLLIAIVVLASLGALSFLAPLKKRVLRRSFFHLALFSAFFLAALKTFRAGMFFAMLATVIAGGNLSAIFAKFARVEKKLSVVLIPAALLASLLLLTRTILFTPVINGSLFPLKAAAFIEAESLPPNIYHPYEWGGYLGFRFHGKHKVFIDGRAARPIHVYNDVLYAQPGWEDILRRYSVNTVIYWPLLPYVGEAPPIVLALLRDEGWSPVYWDMQSVIFVRTPMAARPIGKEAVWELLTSLLRADIERAPGDSSRHAALGEIYLHRGLRYDAEASFRKALYLDPQDPKASFWLDSIKK